MAQIGLKAVDDNEGTKNEISVSNGRPSIIREGLKISGNIRSKSKIEVEGFVKGSITSPEVVCGRGS